MPTSTRGGAVRSDDRAGPRGPVQQKRPPVRPDDRAKPALAGPWEPPHPVLANAGMNMGIGEFNDRVQAAVTAHQHGLGRDPSPGLVLDVVRSPLDPVNYEQLFKLPTSPRLARLSGVASTTGEDVFVQRPDGRYEPRTPFSPPTGTQGPLTETEPVGAKYPWVASGFLPVHGFGTFVEAVKALSQGDAQAQIQHGGRTLAQYQAEVKKGGSPALGKYLAYTSSPDYAKTEQALSHVQTVKQAQTQLNDLMGTSLPVTGYVNDDWAKAISDWQKSTAYFQKTTKFIADQQGLTVHDFVQAWHNQQDLVRKHPLAAHLVEALPLRTLVHPNSYWGSTADVGEYLKGRSNNPLNIALHGLTRSAGLALDVIGGTVNSAKADAAAAHDFAIQMDMHNASVEEAKAHAVKVLKANPSWLRVIHPSLSEHPTGWLKALDTTSNFAVDLLVLRKPEFTGERLSYGATTAEAMRSSYVHAGSGMAFRYLEKGQVGRAAAMLEGGQGAEKLATAAEPLVRRGLMSPQQFKQHVAELTANGETTLTVKGGTITVKGPLLRSLRDTKLVTPSYAGQGYRAIKTRLRDVSDGFDKAMRGSRLPLTTNAADFLSTMRAEFSHVGGGTHGLYDPRTPERIHDWALAQFKDAGLANKWESDFVRARAHEDITRMTGVVETMRGAWHQKFNVGAGAAKAEFPFNALLETEAPAVLHLPTGGQKEARSYFDKTSDLAKKINEQFNKVGKFERKLVVSGAPIPWPFGGMSLLWKHTFGDGGRFLEAGGLSLKPLKDTRATWEQMLQADPALERQFGTFLERSTSGEKMWMLGRGTPVNRTSFTTGQLSELGRGANYTEQAGGYLRRRLTSTALDAYQRSTASDLSPLVDAILHDKDLRGVWKAARRREGIGATGAYLSAEEQAQRIWNDYEQLRVAGEAQGVNVFDHGLDVLRSNRGANADRELGKWIKSSGLDFEVRGALPEHVPMFDQVANWQINKLMSPNRFYRGKLAGNVFLRHFKEATEAGFEPKVAAQVAMDVAERVTVQHMLDFSNMLKIEQDMRWVSLFATKHRLYWKWVMSTFLRHPGRAVLAADVQQHLDSKGNINFELFGVKLALPVTRLFWIPGKEYSEVAPPAQAAAGFLKGIGSGETPGQAFGDAAASASGTNGNIFTRDDTAFARLFSYARSLGGGTPATYTGATAHMSSLDRARFNRDVNEFQVNYMHEHGHYASEQDAVKHVLLQSTAQQFWRANLPLPILPATPDRTPQQKLLAKFMSIDDPTKRSDFLTAHKAFAAGFGVYQDPHVFLRNREFFARYTASLDTYRAARQQLFVQAESQGFTPEIAQAKKKLDAAFQASFDDMLKQDAGVKGKGRVPNGYSIPYGPWGKLIESDPLINPHQTMKALFPHLKPQEYGKIIGSLQTDLQHELALLNDPKYAASYTPEEVKTMRVGILQKLEPFRAYPKDALGKIQQAYQTRYVNQYWKEYNRRYNEIHGKNRVPDTERPLYEAQFYAWREAQDKPVTVNGVKFPSPLRMAWATLDPVTRARRLAYMASANWDHLTGYEKELLGAKQHANTDQGWLYLQEAKDAYRKQYPGASVHQDQLRTVAKQIDKVVPGFYRDYLTAQEPLIRRYESMSLYRDLPSPEKTGFDQYIGRAAKTAAQAIASKNYTVAQIRAEWVAYIDKQVTPWLNDPANAGLKKRLALYGPNFLHSLIEK